MIQRRIGEGIGEEYYTVLNFRVLISVSVDSVKVNRCKKFKLT